MITNLLDATVKTNALHVGGEGETFGKIRGIYEKNGFIMVILASNEGKIHIDIPVEKLEIFYEKIYAVVMFWNDTQKIKAIKALRRLTDMDLKSAKEFVEANPNAVKIKNKLTYEEAEDLRRIIIHEENMECEIRKEL
jgi:ribosomal protein L7/L12